MSPSQKRTAALVVGVFIVDVLAMMQWNTKVSLTAPLGYEVPPQNSTSQTAVEPKSDRERVQPVTGASE